MPEQMKRTRDDLDIGSQSEARNTKPREESPRHDDHRSRGGNDANKSTTLVPKILIHNERSMVSTQDAVLTPTTPMTLDESTSNDDETAYFESSANDTKALEREIHTLMKKTDGRSYIPRTELMRVTSPKIVRQVIMEDASVKDMTKEEKEAFAQEVQKRATKLLALCVYARVDMRCLKRLLDVPLGDESLPLGNYQCCHSPECGAAFEGLLLKQGRFMAPEFNIPGEHKSIPSCAVLPIHFVPKDVDIEKPGNDVACSSLPAETEEDAALRERNLAYCGSGAYSRVYRVRIDPDHHQLSKDRNCLFALKEFKDQSQIGDHKFEQERKILHELRKLSSEHIVVHYVTWTQDQKYYMLFPYAECNLREYMKEQQFGEYTKKNILWFLSQFRNLADALRNIHNIIDPQPASPNLASPNPGLRKSAWHHDVKPENILFFRGIGSSKGNFKIADFGSGKVHTLRSGSANTRSLNGTVTYEPPEAQSGERATSRPYDIWSLGCVMLELLVWAILGFESVQSFGGERHGRSFPDSTKKIIIDDAFWEMRTGRSVLRCAVIEKVRILKENILNRESHHFKEVMELVLQMLDTNPKTRIVALELWNMLDRICKQKDADLSVIDDDSIPRPAEPGQSTLPRLSPEPRDRLNPATETSRLGDMLPILTHPTGDSRLMPPPFTSSAPRLDHN